MDVGRKRPVCSLTFIFSLLYAFSLLQIQGMCVFFKKEKGIVKFIGTTDFATGIWLGIELREPSKLPCILYKSSEKRLEKINVGKTG